MYLWTGKFILNSESYPRRNVDLRIVDPRIFDTFFNIAATAFFNNLASSSGKTDLIFLKIVAVYLSTDVCYLKFLL